MGRKAKTLEAVVVGYVRVSTDDQALGVAAQREAISRWAAAQGARVVAVVVDDGVSGATAPEDRPAFPQALEALTQHRAGVLLVSRRDRLARDPMLAMVAEYAVTRRGGRVVSVAGEGTDNAADPFHVFRRFLADYEGQTERLRIRERTKAAMAVKRARGERVGAIPYGSRLAADGCHLEAEPSEAAVVARVVALHAEGLRVPAIVARLEADKVPARGARWYPMTVHRILRAANVGP